MSAARVNSKAIHLPELEEPIASGLRQKRASRLTANLISHKSLGEGSIPWARLGNEMQFVIVLVAVLAVIRFLH